MYLLYDILLYLVVLPLLPCHLLLILLRGKVRQGVGERFGFFSISKLASLQGRKVLWIHAVSVGETRAIVPLVKALKRRFPNYALIVSTTTETGQEIAQGIAELDFCFYFPYDFSFAVKRVLRLINPTLIAIVETEIWPNFMRAAGRQGLPVLMVNGRISDRSFPRYRRLKFFLRPILRQFALLGMQSPLDAERMIAMGAPADRVNVTRNLKFDMQTGGLEGIDPALIRRDFHLADECRVWVAASTHVGEEEQILDVYRRLLQDGMDLVLILVPRHPERCPGVGKYLAENGFPFVLRSGLEKDLLGSGTVLLVDSMGEMLKFMAAADLVFVGGSLVPVGGHNVLEASLMRKPVLFGPHMHNFKEISRLVLEARAGIAISDGDDLYQNVARLLADKTLCQAMGERGYSLVEENRGATDRTLKIIEGILGGQ